MARGRDYGRGFADRDVRSRVDAWVPLALDPKALPRDTHPLLVLGRAAPGATAAQVQQETAVIMVGLEKAYPENKARGTHVEPLTTVIVGPVRPALRILLVAVVLVLLLAVVNVANLALVRGRGRLLRPPSAARSARAFDGSSASSSSSMSSSASVPRSWEWRSRG